MSSPCFEGIRALLLVGTCTGAWVCFEELIAKSQDGYVRAVLPKWHICISIQYRGFTSGVRTVDIPGAEPADGTGFLGCRLYPSGSSCREVDLELCRLSRSLLVPIGVRRLGSDAENRWA